MQITKIITGDNRHSQAASFTQARTHACVLARQLQDSQQDIKELLLEAGHWQKVASDATAQLEHRDSQVMLLSITCLCAHAFHILTLDCYQAGEKACMQASRLPAHQNALHDMTNEAVSMSWNAHLCVSAKPVYI